MAKALLAFLIVFQSVSAFAAWFSVTPEKPTSGTQLHTIHSIGSIMQQDGVGLEIYSGGDTYCEISKDVATKSGFTIGEIMAAAGLARTQIMCLTKDGKTADMVFVTEYPAN